MRSTRYRAARRAARGHRGAMRRGRAVHATRALATAAARRAQSAGAFARQARARAPARHHPRPSAAATRRPPCSARAGRTGARSRPSRVARPPWRALGDRHCGRSGRGGVGDVGGRGRRRGGVVGVVRRAAAASSAAGGAGRCRASQRCRRALRRRPRYPTRRGARPRRARSPIRPSLPRGAPPRCREARAVGAGQRSPTRAAAPVPPPGVVAGSGAARRGVGGQREAEGVPAVVRLERRGVPATLTVVALLTTGRPLHRGGAADDDDAAAAAGRAIACGGRARAACWRSARERARRARRRRRAAAAGGGCSGTRPASRADAGLLSARRRQPLARPLAPTPCRAPARWPDAPAAPPPSAACRFLADDGQAPFLPARWAARRSRRPAVDDASEAAGNSPSECWMCQPSAAPAPPRCIRSFERTRPIGWARIASVAERPTNARGANPAGRRRCPRPA